MPADPRSGTAPSAALVSPGRGGADPRVTTVHRARLDARPVLLPGWTARAPDGRLVAVHALVCVDRVHYRRDGAGPPVEVLREPRGWLPCALTPLGPIPIPIGGPEWTIEAPAERAAREAEEDRQRALELHRAAAEAELERADRRRRRIGGPWRWLQRLLGRLRRPWSLTGGDR